MPGVYLHRHPPPPTRSPQSPTCPSIRLQGSRIVVTEHCLQTLVRLSEVGGGDFLRRRMRLEAWPILSGLLTKGVPPAEHSRGPSPSRALMGGEPQAPAVLGRARLAVLTAVDG